MSTHQQPIAPELREFAWGEGWAGRVAFAIALLFSAFQLWTAATSPLASQIVRAMHVGFLLLLLFVLVGNDQGRHRFRAALFWLLGLAGFATGLYHYFFYSEILHRAGDPNHLDIVMGTVATGLVFVAGYITMGWALPVICGAFLLYGMLGQYLPSPFDHRGFGFDQIIDAMYLGTEGLYGTPTYVSASYIFLFILFGAFLERAGMIQLFNDVSMGLVGRSRGGPAKVAVISSAMMGTISGSGVANVVTVGQFTIPLMKRFGFTSAFAGGVEATASMGGQIMPPVMGAVAFIMAETLGIAYVEVVMAAIIPAILYFGTAFWMVHLEAGRLGLRGLSKAECPNAWRALKERWYLVLPLGVLVYLLFAGYTPLFAGTMGLALTALIVLGNPIGERFGNMALRVVFWITLGLITAGLMRYGIVAVGGVVLALVLFNALSRGGRATLALCRDSLAEGAKNALIVGVACALVGPLIGVLSLTGSATTLAQYIVAIGENSLFLSLILTMVTCIVLGTGIPTIPSYIIVAAIAGPALLHLGVPLLVSHMFVFYFGIMADLTPPVALAAFAAAPIAKESGNRIGWEAMRIALAGFVVPFMAVYAPVLMLQPDNGALVQAVGYWGALAYHLLKVMLAIGLWGAAAIGYLRGPLNWPERFWAFAGAALLIIAHPVTDTAGFVICAAFCAWHFRRTPKEVVPII